MKTAFVIHSNIQAFVENNIGDNVKDILYITIDLQEPKITLLIENETSEDSSNFLINSEDFQNIVDWLKSKKIIK